MDTYFAVANGRYFVPHRIRTEYTILYLFGGDKAYRPSTTAFSSAAEAIAGYCLQQYGYTPLVRPLGVMPDILFQTTRGTEAILALTEAKHSVRRSPEQLIKAEAVKFFLDITTRAKWSSYRYEGFLVASFTINGLSIVRACA